MKLRHHGKADVSRNRKNSNVYLEIDLTNQEVTALLKSLCLNPEPVAQHLFGVVFDAVTYQDKNSVYD
jgi:hypothetical protein